MPKYLVVAKDNEAKTITEIVDSSDQDQAVALIQGRGLFVMSVKESHDGVMAPVVHEDVLVEANKKFGHTGISMDDNVSFARQLATMIEAGVPLLRSLTVIASQVDSRDLHSVLQNIVHEVEGGNTFSSALAKYPRVFSPFWVSLVEVGEASGTMPKVLEKLASYMEDEAAFRSTVRGALIYPGVLFAICILAVLFFALFIGPTFERIFKDMGVALPGITVVMLTIFKVVKEKFLLFVAGAVIAFFLFKNHIKAGAGRLWFERLLFKLPVVGNIVKVIVVEKFTSQMAILIESGVPILYALEIAERLVDNMVCAAVIKEVSEGVREGRLLAEPMEKNGFFPPMTVQMVRVGEETGELGKMLNHVAGYYKKNVEDFLKRFGTLIEPVMLVVMGGIIGTIVISMFLPILSLATG